MNLISLTRVHLNRNSPSPRSAQSLTLTEKAVQKVWIRREFRGVLDRSDTEALTQKGTVANR